MRSRIVGLALVAAASTLVLFGLPLAIGLGQYAMTEERASLQRLADFAARSVQNDMAHDRVPDRLPDGPRDAAVAVYDDDGDLLLGSGPSTGGERIDQVLRRDVASAVHTEDLVAVAPVSDTHDVVGAVQVTGATQPVIAGLLPLWLGMGVLAGIVLLAVWALARRLARTLSRPLEDLAQDAGRLGEGDFGIRPSPTGVREVDLVGAALAETAQRLDDLLVRERSFSTEASHQLKTPLAGLRLRLESTLDRPDRLTRETVEEGLASIDRLERTIDELLLLARERRRGAVPVDIDRLLGEAEEEWTERLAREGRAFRTSRAHDVPDPPASAAAVRQIVGVLLDNALTHGAGTVAITAREAGADAVAIDIADEGPGLPPDTLAGSSNGSGLGVALARRLAESEGGRLTARRCPSVVTVLLPLAPVPDGAEPDPVPAP